MHYPRYDLCRVPPTPSLDTLYRNNSNSVLVTRHSSPSPASSVQTNNARAHSKSAPTQSQISYRLLAVLVLLASSPLARSISPLGLTLSMLGRSELELELERRLRLLSSSGSRGDRPLTRAKRLSTSVKLTTPFRRPDMFAPGICAADTATPGPVLVYGGPAVAVVSGPWCEERAGDCKLNGAMEAVCIPGLGGTEPAGEGDSTIHIRCERVAQSLATVCARVECGVT
jgi:hypothetical protein